MAQITYLAPFIATQADVIAGDPTKLSYSGSVEVPAGRIYVGVAALQADNGDVMSINLGGDSANVTLKHGSLENKSGLYFEDGRIVTVTTPGVKTLTVTSGTGSPTIEGVIVRAPDPRSGIVEDQWHSAHCWPLDTWYKNHLYSVHTEMVTGNVFLSKDGAPVGQLFTGLTADRNDNYHIGTAICAHRDGLVVAAVGHKQAGARIRFLPQGEFSAITPETTLGDPLGELTYCMLQALNNGQVLMLCRGDDTATADEGAIVFRISGVTGSPTYTVDVVSSPSSYRMYPLYFKKMTAANGLEMIGAAWLVRAGNQWQGVNSAVFDPAANGGVGEWFSLNPAVNGTNVLGTSGTPRFTDTQSNTGTTSQTHEGEGINLLALLTGGTRYGITPAISFNEWPTRAKLAMIFMDRAASTDPNVYGTADLRYMAHQGDARLITDALLDTVMSDPNNYRVSGVMAWVGGNEASDLAWLLISNRGTRTRNNAYGEAVGPYYDLWSGNTLEIFQVSAATTASPVATHIGSIKVRGGYTGGHLRAIENIPDGFMYSFGVNESHETHQQAHDLMITLNGTPTISEVSSGVRRLRTR